MKMDFIYLMYNPLAHHPSEKTQGIRLSQFYNNVTNANGFIVPVDDAKVYMPVVSWSRVFAQAIQAQDFGGSRVIEVGVGSGLNMAGMMLSDRSPLRFTGVDISKDSIEASAELAHGRNWEKKVRLEHSDLLEGLSDKHLRKADHIIACIPQIPVRKADIGRHRDLADYYVETGIVEDQYGLGLAARLLDQVAERAPQASVTLNIAGRPGGRALKELFSSRGFVTQTLYKEVVRQEPYTSVRSLAQKESAMKDFSFSFYEDRKATRKVDAVFAEHMREHGASVYHKLSVVRARLG